MSVLLLRTIPDDPVINCSNNYSLTLKNSLRPIAYLFVSVLAAGLLTTSLYFCTLISGGAVLLAMLITLSICSVLCVIYLFYQQSGREKITVFSINSPSIFFSEETLNLLLGRKEDSDINKLLKNFAFDDFRRPKMLPLSSFLDEQGRSDADREARLKYFQQLLKNVVTKILELKTTPPKKFNLLLKFVNNDLANSSVAALYEGLISVLESPGEEVLEMLFSLDPTWIKSTLGLDKTLSISKEAFVFAKLMKYCLISPEARDSEIQINTNAIELVALSMQNINLLLSALCLRSSHDRLMASGILQKFCPNFSIQEIKKFIEQKNILALLLNRIFEGEEKPWLASMSLNLNTIIPASLYPQPDPSCWKAINSTDYAKNSSEKQEDFNKTKEACKLALKKLVLPELSVRLIGQILKLGNFKKGKEELEAVKQQIINNPFLFLEALLESEELVLSVAKYLKRLMPLYLWDKLFHIIYSGYFQIGLICQGEVNTFCNRANLELEVFQAALQQGRLLSFLFPKMLLD